MQETRIDIEESLREELEQTLNDCLADTLFGVLSAKQAHWNVIGPGFLPAHRLFDEVYEFYSKSADILGERIRSLGGIAKGLLLDLSRSCSLSYEETGHGSVQEHTSAMADLLGQIANHYRDAIEDCKEDKATQDVFIELTRDADQLLYFLESELR